MGLRFDPGQIPPDSGGICWAELEALEGGFEEKTRGRMILPASLLKGLRPFGIPLLRRISCAAGWRMRGLHLYPGQIPPDGGGICLGGVGGFGEKTRGRMLLPTSFPEDLRPFGIPLLRRIFSPRVGE